MGTSLLVRALRRVGGNLQVDGEKSGLDPNQERDTSGDEHRKEISRELVPAEMGSTISTG